MTKEELLVLAQKTGKAFWKGLQKLTVGAATVISAVINGSFSLISGYCAARRRWRDEFWKLSVDKQLVMLSCRLVEIEFREGCCWFLIIAATVVTFLCWVNIVKWQLMSSAEQTTLGVIVGICYLSIVPMLIFMLQALKIKMMIVEIQKTLNCSGGQDESHTF